MGNEVVSLRLVGGPHHGGVFEQSRSNPHQLVLVPALDPRPMVSFMDAAATDCQPLLHHEYGLTKGYGPFPWGVSYVYRFIGQDRLNWCEERDEHTARLLLSSFRGVQQIRRTRALDRLNHCWLLSPFVVPSATVLDGYQVLRSPHYDQPMFADMGDIHGRMGIVPASQLFTAERTRSDVTGQAAE
jgi:hypothetical protein